MGGKKIRLTYHLRKKQPIEHGIGIFVDLKYFFAVYMIVGYGIYALTGHREVIIKDAFLLVVAVILSYIFRNYIMHSIGFIIMQLMLILSSNIWCRYRNEKVLCILFLAGWSIYSMLVRIKENNERTFQNEGLFAILLGVPMEVLADYYHYTPVKSLVFWLGFFLILTHFLIKYMIDFMKYFEQAGQANITIKENKLKSHLLLAGYGVIGMGVMLLLSRLPLQGIWNGIKHGIYLLLRKFFHMLEEEPVRTRWDPSPAPVPSPKGSITMFEGGSWSIDLKWLRAFYDYIFEMIRVVVIVVIILCAFKLIYTIFQNMNKKEKGIEEEKEFIHLSEMKERTKEKRRLEKTKKENIKDNQMKVRKLFAQIMKKQGIEKYNRKNYMTSHEMCHAVSVDKPDIVETIYQKARYSNEDISGIEVDVIKAQYKQTKEKGK